MATKNSDVTKFLDGQNLPLRKEIEQLRHNILSAEAQLSENIKWNSPNYCYQDQDRITMRIQPDKIQLIFHRGAKVQEQPKEKLIKDNSELLLWKGNDRAIATFKTLAEIENRHSELSKTIKEWIIATT